MPIVRQSDRRCARRFHGRSRDGKRGVRWARPAGERLRHRVSMAAIVDDTYAEAFRSIYVEFLITARDLNWVLRAAHAATGNASSTILCDCEAGVDRLVGPGADESIETPDG